MAEKIVRTFQGEVVSAKMAKTVVVRVDTMKQHSKYNKRYTVSAQYKVHDEHGTCKVGDTVTFVECRPLSKDKRYRLIA